MQKRTGQYIAILTAQRIYKDLIKDLLYGRKENLFLRDQRGKSRAGKMSSGSQSEHRIPFILPARGFSHKTIFVSPQYLPKEELYTPPMNIKVHDNRSFGRKPVVGIHSMKSMIKFRCEPASFDDALESPIG